MDSLTQITLGAAVGEVVLGKKAGNRAMIWGAVAGTIPDLDIMANFFMNEISALAAHRGFSHSLLFAVIAPPLFGWLVHRFYQNKFDRYPVLKLFFSGIGVLFSLLLLTQVVFRPILRGETPGLTSSLIVCLMVAWLSRRIWSYNRTPLSNLGEEPSWKEWSWLFFWGIFTHPLLDCFTTYGTQIFQPFSDYRVSLNTISVADPAYTIPFLLCLIVASYLLRGSKNRAIFNWLGIGLSSTYLLFTVFNKINFNRHFENSLTQNNIQYSRYMSTPTIFNQILWVGIAESEHKYYYGTRSWFDKTKTIHLDSLYKGHHLLAPYEMEWQIDILKWFSDGYFNVMEAPGDEIVFNDIRFGVIGNLEIPRDTASSPFQFFMSRTGDEFFIEQRRDWDRDMGKEFGKLGRRILGE